MQMTGIFFIVEKVLRVKKAKAKYELFATCPSVGR
jgi:hypothetical protein